MTIESSVVYSDRPYGATQKKVTERHTDQLGIHYDVRFITDNDYDVQASLDANAIIVNQQTIDTEIANGIAECYVGGDPLHFDVGGSWDKVTPDYQTWDELMLGVSINFLSQTDQLELVWWSLPNSRISSTDKERVWDMSQTEVSSVNADIQIAIDTQATLDLYAPYFNADGSKP